MADIERLKGLCGIYKQNDGNTFVIQLNGDKIYLKTDKINGEELVARGDGLYDVLNTQAKVKFNIGLSGIPSSLTFYLSDRQTVATREVVELNDKSLLEKFKELGIAIVVFLALVGTFFLSYVPIKKACLNGGSAFACRTAMISARILGKTEDAKRLTNQESKTLYVENAQQTNKACQTGNVKACLEEARSLVRINNIEKANQLLEKNCYTMKDGQSCQFWRDTMINSGETDFANKIMETSCEKDVAIGCHEIAWRLRRMNKNGESLIYFKKACRLQEEKSCYELGLYHLKYNREESLQHLISACKLYHRQGCDLKEKLEKYYEHKKKCDEDKVPLACFLIASLEHDLGDKELALKQYQYACKLGNSQSCDIINTLEKTKKIRKSGDKIETL